MSLADFFEYEAALKDGILNSIETVLPARVSGNSYNSSTKTANIEILLRRKDKDNNNKDIPIIPEVNVHFLNTKYFSIDYPLSDGDTGRLVIFSKDISKYKKSGGKTNQVWFQKFALHNSIFIPDFHPQNKTSVGEIEIKITTDNDLIINQKGEQKAKLFKNGKWNITPTEDLLIEFNENNEIIFKQGLFERFKLNNLGVLTELNNISTETSLVSKTITAPDVNINGITNITGTTYVIGALGTSTGATGTFISKDDKTITVLNGIITSIV